MVREALQRKLAEMGANGVSVLAIPALPALAKSPTQRLRASTRGSVETSSPTASEATLPPGRIRSDTIGSVFLEAATPLSPPEAPHISFGLDAALAASAR